METPYQYYDDSNYPQQNKDILGKTIDLMTGQAKAIELMYRKMIEMQKDTENNVAKIEEVKEDIIQLKKDIEVQIGLSDAEAGVLQVTVHKKATSLCWLKVDKEHVQFCNWIGKIRARIWAQLKMKFEVKQYVKIPRKNFRNAIEFVNSITFDDIDYEGKRERWLERREEDF